MLSKITVSPSPHISKAHSTRSIMLDVVIALVPAMVMACWYFRAPAIILIVTCVVSCAATEWLCNLIRSKPDSVNDLSAVVTGIILALSLPPSLPVWVAVIGSAFAIAIGKMVFGGLGANIFNPAMASRAFLTASFGMLMTTWTVPATIDATMPVLSAAGADAITQATPLSWSKQAIKGKADAAVVNEQITATVIGGVGGCLGETSAIALLLGGAYLLFRRTISFHIPAAVLVSAFVFAAIWYFSDPQAYVSPILHITGGGMLMCALFIATDPVTAPLPAKGMWIFGIGVGMLVVLIMNALTPLIDRFCKLVPVGGKTHG